MKLAYSINGQVLREWYNDREHEELFDVLRDSYDGVELYLGNNRSSTEKTGFFDIAEDAGLEVLSAHAPRLNDLHKPNGYKEVVGTVNEYFTEYNQEGTREKVRNLEQVTMHPSQKKGQTTSEDWKTTIYNLALASQTLKSWGHPQAPSIENCARFEPPYILTESSDMQALVDEAESNEMLDMVDVPVNLTLDPGHAPGHTYTQMIDAVESSEKVNFSSIHLHGKIDSDDQYKKDKIRSEFGIPPNKEIGTEDWDGEVDHIPPGMGDIDMSELERVIEGDTLVTVELHPTYFAHPEAASYSADTARDLSR